jgi:hypothetical protein
MIRKSTKAGEYFNTIRVKKDSIQPIQEPVEKKTVVIVAENKVIALHSYDPVNQCYEHLPWPTHWPKNVTPDFAIAEGYEIEIA